MAYSVILPGKCYNCARIRYTCALNSIPMVLLIGNFLVQLAIQVDNNQ